MPVWHASITPSLICTWLLRPPTLWLPLPCVCRAGYLRQVEFLKRWFQAVVPLKAAGRFRTGDDKSETRLVMARENFLLAASYAANTDLSAFFSTLRWPALTADAAALLAKLLVRVEDTGCVCSFARANLAHPLVRPPTEACAAVLCCALHTVSAIPSVLVLQRFSPACRTPPPLVHTTSSVVMCLTTWLVMYWFVGVVCKQAGAAPVAPPGTVRSSLSLQCTLSCQCLPQLHG